ncbi:ubiquitin-like small modifier protein 1 [Euzebya tangerina]|uniref:ubiquitin-like small modifier protein 1 n=1 Tax=Euzebya tangerina TaxID=591198 RepID=UPI000E324C81|nr:ubiquitin-like small modifier protein 1 [Euzebya tangerina]
MAVSVRVPTVLRKHTDGNATVEGDGATITALLADLADRHAGLTQAITAEDGGLAGFINVYLNDEDIRFMDGVDTELRDGDELSLLPAVAGGS